MEFTIGESARLLEVDVRTVRHWLNKFKDPRLRPRLGEADKRRKLLPEIQVIEMGKLHNVAVIERKVRTSVPESTVRERPGMMDLDTRMQVLERTTSEGIKVLNRTMSKRIRVLERTVGKLRKEVEANRTAIDDLVEGVNKQAEIFNRFVAWANKDLEDLKEWKTRIEKDLQKGSC